MNSPNTLNNHFPSIHPKPPWTTNQLTISMYLTILDISYRRTHTIGNVRTYDFQLLQEYSKMWLQCNIFNCFSKYGQSLFLGFLIGWLLGWLVLSFSFFFWRGGIISKTHKYISKTTYDFIILQIKPPYKLETQCVSVCWVLNWGYMVLKKTFPMGAWQLAVSIWDKNRMDFYLISLF